MSKKNADIVYTTRDQLKDVNLYDRVYIPVRIKFRLLLIIRMLMVWFLQKLILFLTKY